MKFGGSILLPILMASPLATMVKAQVNYEACSFSTVRGLGTTAMYSRQEQGVCFVDNADVDAVYKLWAPPSEVYACIQSFSLDAANVTQYLQATMDITKDYYPFADIAVDAVNSDPNTTPFGFPIYNGTGAGQVDVMARMQALKDKVETEGQATLDIFLEVNDIYSELLDGHMSINVGLDTNGMLDDYSIVFLAEEVTKQDASSVDLRVLFPTENDEFVLMADINSNTGTESKKITQIDGTDPLSFFTTLSSTSPFYSNYKSLGPRVQNMVAAFTSGKQEFFFGALVVGPGATNVLTGMSGPNLAKLIKDQYDVVYEDGTETTWQAVQAIPCPVANNSTKTDIEMALTKPGILYQITELQASRVFDAPVFPSQETAQSATMKKLTRQIEMPSSNVKFEMYGSDDNPIGFAFFDDYAVMKVYKGFSFDAEDMYRAWEDLTDKAAEQGVTKLIVDIIGNGGGNVDNGYQLAQLMYPNADWTDFNNPYDLVYSPALDIYANKVAPLWGFIEARTGNMTAMEESAGLLNQDPEALVTKLIRARNILMTLLEHDSTDKSESQDAVEMINYILDQVLQRNTTSIQPIEVKLLLNAIQEAGKQLGDPNEADQYFSLANDQSVVHNRGGIEGNYTNQFYFVSPTKFMLGKLQSLSSSNAFQFDEYLLVADGNGVGSTANTFMSTAVQYAKSNQGNAPPLHTVSYGGTGLLEDAAVTQYPGGSVDEAKLSPLAVPDLILAVLWTLAQGSTLGGEVLEIFTQYDEAIPTPCYFCNEFPNMAVWEAYSAETQNQGIPLEYVNQRPDLYIKQWPTKTSFKDDGDLPELYDRVADFFGKGTSDADGAQESVNGDDLNVDDENSASIESSVPTESTVVGSSGSEEPSNTTSTGSSSNSSGSFPGVSMMCATFMALLGALAAAI